MLFRYMQRIMSETMASSTLPARVPIPRRGVDYRGKIALAPMVRSGELPTRLLALHYGADLVWSPETVDKSMIGTTRRYNPANQTIEWSRVPHRGQKQPPAGVPENVLFQVHPEKEAGKLIFQMGTADPAIAVEAAKVIAADVAGIDVNAGCPKPFSTHCGMGAALLKTPDKLVAILEALVKNIVPEFEIGISVKIRLLADPRDTEVLVRRLCSTGIIGLTIHCRTTPMRPREPAIREQLSMVARVCHEAGVACLVNGDVEDRDHGLRLMEEFGVDGAMIARAAETNASCFRSTADGGLEPWQAVASEYVQLAMSVHNKFGNTKYLLGQIIPGKERLHPHMNQTKTYSSMCELLGLSDLQEVAEKVDAIKGLDKKNEKLSSDIIRANKLTNESAKAAGGQAAAATTSKKKKPLRGVAGLPKPKPKDTIESIPPTSSPQLTQAATV